MCIRDSPVGSVVGSDYVHVFTCPVGWDWGSDDVFTSPVGSVVGSDYIFTCPVGWDWGRMMYLQALWVRWLVLIMYLHARWVGVWGRMMYFNTQWVGVGVG